MNVINWKIGESYEIHDIMLIKDGVFIGYIINQIPCNWKDKQTWSNHPDTTKHLVFKLEEGRFCIAKPVISSRLENPKHSRTYLKLEGREYSDTIEGLIAKIKSNWVFTSEVSYEAQYKEGYVDEKLKDYACEKANS